MPGRVTTGYNWGYFTDVELAFQALTAPGGQMGLTGIIYGYIYISCCLYINKNMIYI